VIGTSLFGEDGLALPFWLAGAGNVASLMGMLLLAVLVHYWAQDTNPAIIVNCVRVARYATSLFFLLLARVACNYLLFEDSVYICVLSGHLAGVFLMVSTEMTSSSKLITDVVVAHVPKKLQRVTPMAQMLLRGLMVGMGSTVFPVLVTFAVLMICGQYGQSFGIVIGMSRLYDIRYPAYSEYDDCLHLIRLYDLAGAMSLMTTSAILVAIATAAPILGVAYELTQEGHEDHETVAWLKRNVDRPLLLADPSPMSCLVFIGWPCICFESAGSKHS